MGKKKVQDLDIIYLDEETDEEYKDTDGDIIDKRNHGKESKVTNNKGTPQKNASNKTTSPKDTSRKASRKRKPASSGWKKAAVAGGVTVVTIALLYGGVAAYFMSHFLMNTEINGYDFTAKSAAEAEEFWAEQVKKYALTVKENGGHTETIKATDIGLAYKDEDAFEKLLEKQNAFLWLTSLFEETKMEVPIDVSYDESRLAQKIENLGCLKQEQIPSVSAYPKYDGEKFVPEKEVIGTAVDMEKLNEKIRNSMEELAPQLDMVEEDCYAFPKYTAESPEVKKACDDMNLYLRASITYQMDTEVVLDKDTISTWLSTDGDMNVIFSEDAVKAWLTEFGDKYDTYDKVRNFTTPWGRAVEVQPGKMSWGGYGWAVDEGAEFNAIMQNIRDGAVVVREPAYLIGQRAAVHGNPDWGGTYLEVDITAQHMWYFRDGQIAFECDVITGLPNPARKTPDGVYRVLEKCTDYTMTGNIDPATGEPEYVSHVDYWMRVTWGGVGFHDATWQPGFGGELYKTYGSHGCINMSYSSIQTLYPMVEVGTPIVIHY